MSLVLELWAFLKERKKLWLWPVLLMLSVLAVLLVIAQSSAVAPFIYTIF